MSLLYHVTSKSNIGHIQTEGIRAGSYFVSEEWESIVDYYKETVEDEGDVPVVLAVELESLDAKALAPDQNGIDEPLTFTLGMKESEVKKAWRLSNKDWESSMQIIGTCRYSKTIDPSLIIFPEMNPSPRP